MDINLCVAGHVDAVLASLNRSCISEFCIAPI